MCTLQKKKKIIVFIGIAVLIVGAIIFAISNQNGNKALENKYNISESVKLDIKDSIQSIDKDVMEDSLMDKTAQWMNMTDCTDDEKMAYKRLADYYGQSLLVYTATLDTSSKDYQKNLKKQEDSLNEIREEIYKMIN